MKCPNCGSSRVRQSKRTAAEKVFLSMLVTRPFRCEDCIARFNSWIWRSAPDQATTTPDENSLVYRSATAALHTGVYRSRKKRRRAKTGNLRPAATSISNSVGSWLKKPIQQPKVVGQKAQVAIVRQIPDPAPQGFLPVILGVILEMKHETS